MLFNSVNYLIFFPVVATLYFLLPHRARWALLLSASCLFYMAFVPAYILILLFTILIDYAAGLLIERAEGARRKAYLVISLVSNCAILFVFKYFNFVNANVAGLAEVLHWNYPIGGLEILLPIGLSFHTFQAMSYTIEVYRGSLPAERHLGIYALYVMFFPQLVAGPIERPQNLLHQFRTRHDFDPARASAGLSLMLWGMFKKVVVADRLAVIVDVAYNQPTEHTGLSLLVATVLFSFQIYCDFSGYSDIAIGSAEVLGYRLMENFRTPYFAASVGEFWRRWHISLSTWFKDYVYVPLGGNRVPLPRRCLNLMIVFLISGLWHGANWTYVAWGALHGAYLVAALLAARPIAAFWSASGLDSRPGLKRLVGVLTTFALVTVGWVFFRANSLGDALLILGRIATDLGSHAGPILPGVGSEALTMAAVVVAVLLVVELLQRGRTFPQALATRPGWVRWPVYLAASLAVMNLGIDGQLPFIYFQF